MKKKINFWHRNRTKEKIWWIPNIRTRVRILGIEDSGVRTIGNRKLRVRTIGIYNLRVRIIGIDKLSVRITENGNLSVRLIGIDIQYYFVQFNSVRIFFKVFDFPLVYEENRVSILPFYASNAFKFIYYSENNYPENECFKWLKSMLFSPFNLAVRLDEQDFLFDFLGSYE